MLRATKDLMLPTTITGSLPRPSWYTRNLGPRSFMHAMVEQPLPRAIRRRGFGLSARAGDRRPRYRHRWRRAFRQDVGGQSWTNYPTRHMAGFDRGSRSRRRAGQGGLAFPPGHILHDYLEARVMPASSVRSAAATCNTRAMWKAAQRHDQEAGEVRHHRAGAGRLRRAPTRTTKRARPHPGHRRCVQRGTARARRRRLPGDPVRGAADPPARRAQYRRRGHQSGVQRRGVQSHGEGPARQDRGVVPHLLGQPVAAAHVRAGAELQEGAGDAQQGRRRRDHLRVLQRRRHGPRSFRQDHHRTRRSPSA